MTLRNSIFFILPVVLLQLGCGGGRQPRTVFPASSAPVQEIAARARKVLEAKCFQCHGKDGNSEGGFDFALNRDRLVGKLVVPGAPDKSRLLDRIDQGEMPPEDEAKIGPLTSEEKKVVRDWIAAGAPDFSPPQIERPFVGPQQVLAAIQADLESLEPRDRKFTRYFTLTHLHNAGYSVAEIENYRRSLAKLINSLSWGNEIEVPKPVDNSKTILRIDIRHYKWNESDAWNQIVAVDPYKVTETSAAAQYCIRETGCETPHLRGDWFVFSASRPPLYHVILEIPKTDRELETKLRVNVAANLRDFQAKRAAFGESGVSASNRLIERHSSEHGAYWKSYDFADSTGKQHLFSHPLGPGNGKYDFQHDGGELIFSLPNGLQAYMLVKANGDRIDEGPPEIVEDKTARQRGERDSKVLNGISCMSCHSRGMITKDDEVRIHVTKNRVGFDQATFDAVQALYPVQETFRMLLDKDAKRYADAVALTGAELSDVDPVASLARQFNQALTAKLAAAEAGITLAEFEKAIRNSPELARSIGNVFDGGTIPRAQFAAVFSSLSDTVGSSGPKNESQQASAVAPLTPLPQSHLSAKPIPLPKAADEREDNALGLKLVWCPPGNFKMGSPASEENHQEDESQVPVEFTHGFWMGKHEVMQGEFAKVMGTAPWKGEKIVKEGANVAASYVSHDDAVEFCRKLTMSERAAGRLRAQQEYRLPSEAQWEYACRAGTTTAYSFPFGTTDAKLGEYAWFEKNTYDEDERFAHPVGLKKPNAFGLFDMHGNVYEWCRDGYAKQLPGGTNPEVAFDGRVRVLRGGSWGHHGSGICRSAARRPTTPGYRYLGVGFRVSRTP